MNKNRIASETRKITLDKDDPFLKLMEKTPDENTKVSMLKGASKFEVVSNRGRGKEVKIEIGGSKVQSESDGEVELGIDDSLRQFPDFEGTK